MSNTGIGEIILNEKEELTIDDSLSAVTGIMESPFDRSLSVEGISVHLKSLLGDVLTIVDASMADPVQRKATKDIVKKAFYGKMDWIFTLVTDPNIDVTGEAHLVLAKPIGPKEPLA